MAVRSCPICGKWTNQGIVAAPGIPGHEQHRCSERTLRGIDAAGRGENPGPYVPTEGEQLAEGFRILGGEDT